MERGDFIFVPAYRIQQHFNSDPENEARLIVITNRIFKAMGLNWLSRSKIHRITTAISNRC